ncbi:MAG: ATP-grasp domain-containing protein [Methylococcaceae bacterium]|nr:ATP-grasp domain-containing protein [Methylococcaceae bacterium]MDZ4155494.1 ATP-grasp domain-containing protein [Methylococcales bacterium]
MFKRGDRFVYCDFYAKYDAIESRISACRQCVTSTVFNLAMQQKLLIVGQSARMLAYAAKQIGLNSIVIDVYSDSDTQAFALEFCQIPDLSKCYLIPALSFLIARHSISDVIYSSGFEEYPDSLGYLTEKLEVLGNNYKTFVAVQDKKSFFSTLGTLKIPHPDVSFIQPELAEDWLIKPMFGHGGIGIKRFSQTCNVDKYFYWQKFLIGAQHSVLFLADGEHAQVVGFNTQWTLNSDEKTEFIFSGIINSCELRDEYKQNVVEWIEKLVPVYGLLGLNSLDFIYTNGACFVLEINPRPSASMQLYDVDLLSRHIRACNGELTPNLPLQTRAAAYQVIYAEDDLTIPVQFYWPEGVVDIPKAGALIRKGQPICSIIVHEKNTQLVLVQLAIKQQQLIKNLEGTD